MKKSLLFLFSACALLMFSACAGERQGLVCEEIEYRLNTQTYSPDQRAYIEEELRVCREEEAQKKSSDAATRQSIYDRYAASDTTAKSSDKEVNVSEALQDTSGVPTTSIYDRYANQESAAPAEETPAESPADNAEADVSSFQ